MDEYYYYYYLDNCDLTNYTIIKGEIKNGKKRTNWINNKKSSSNI